MTVDISTKLAAIRSIVDDIAVHLATQGATSPIAPVPPRHAVVEVRLTERLAAVESALDSLLGEMPTSFRTNWYRELHDRLDTIERAMEAIDARSRMVDDRLEAVDTSLAELGGKAEGIRLRIERIEQQATETRVRLTTVEQNTAGLHNRLDAMEAAWQDHVDPGRHTPMPANIVRSPPPDVDKDIPF